MSGEKQGMGEENFAEMFEQSMQEVGRYEPGQMVETSVVSVSGGAVFLELGGKSEGVLDADELLGEDGQVTVQAGDQIRAYFVAAKNGELHFTTKISGDRAGREMLQNAYQAGVPVEGNVDKEIKGGFEVKVGETRAFCPFSQMGLQRIDDPAQWVGKTLTFKIIEYKEEGRNVLVSHRVILEEERQQQIEKLKSSLEEGMTVRGTVVSLRDFGAFVDLQGIQALLPVSEISRSRIDKVSDTLTVGQDIDAQVLSIDWDRERISLSLKALQADPWDDAESKYPRGSEHQGTVVRLTDFGAFVSLEPGLDGLIHVSELRGDGGRVNPRNVLSKGEEISVRINSVDTESQRISLKPASVAAEEEGISDYLGSADDGGGHNPFAQFMKEKKKK